MLTNAQVQRMYTIVLMAYSIRHKWLLATSTLRMRWSQLVKQMLGLIDTFATRSVGSSPADVMKLDAIN